MIKKLKERIKNHRTGLGMAALGRPGYMTLTHDTDLPDKSWEAMKKHAHEMLDLAWQRGIRYFDVARSYGDGEKFLSSWLHNRKINKQEVVIGSKWGYVYVADWQVDVETHEIKYHTRENLDKQWLESQSILKDYLNIYHIHSATLESGVLDNEEVLEKLAEIKKEGVLIGLSLTGPNQDQVLKKARNIRFEGDQLFSAVQATWNILEPTVGDELIKAASDGWFVILKEVMANGRIASASSENLSAEQIKMINDLKEKYQLSADQLAMKAALQQTYADIVLSGAASESHLISNLKATKIDKIIDFPAEISESADIYWKKRSNLAWI